MQFYTQWLSKTDAFNGLLQHRNGDTCEIAQAYPVCDAGPNPRSCIQIHVVISKEHCNGNKSQKKNSANCPHFKDTERIIKKRLKKQSLTIINKLLNIRLCSAFIKILRQLFAACRTSFTYIWTTLWWTNSLPWKMAIEIVDFPIKNGDFPLLC